MTWWADWQSHGTLQIMFQPIIALTDFHIVGYEVLSRPYTADGQPIPVEAFFDEVARKGHAVVVDQRVLTTVTEFVRHQGLALTMPLFWNVHPDSIAHGVLTQARRFLAPDQFVVEVTEKGDWGDAVIQALREHRQAGYRIALDDFGAGYSGLNRLIQIQPTIVKLDRLLIQGIDRDPIKRQLVQAVTQLGPHFGFRVLAEGVETADELVTILRLQVDLAQGYYFARPALWDQISAEDAAWQHALLSIRAQEILANQWMGHDAQQTWQTAWPILIQGACCRSASVALGEILRRAEHVTRRHWRVAQRSPAGWRLWTPDGPAWASSPLLGLLEAWQRHPDPPNPWVWQDTTTFFDKPGAAAIWRVPMRPDVVIVAWTGWLHAWASELLAWGETFSQLVGLVGQAESLWDRD
ncbi:diguanylate phosphodiesterase [Sulfobacillus acidophilus TPY]|uniref:Diguanylate phosphodiesterase n=1 Tax=Sulfobacillus acidophilus (strain ATCC 700253 / DSM 10332 / NAL) TaxID=679936 RepID=G8TUK2_SULAD|nr:diguanylate phosphodiesterase [Sulfobacillus acidophilus TPY]AEW04649.1 diguanylate phosphodiesterase [Sulfobacillus acidophilus DSM 10332]